MLSSGVLLMFGPAVLLLLVFMVRETQLIQRSRARSQKPSIPATTGDPR